MIKPTIFCKFTYAIFPEKIKASWMPLFTIMNIALLVTAENIYIFIFTLFTKHTVAIFVISANLLCHFYDLRSSEISFYRTKDGTGL